MSVFKKWNKRIIYRPELLTLWEIINAIKSSTLKLTYQHKEMSSDEALYVLFHIFYLKNYKVVPIKIVQ